MAETPAPSPLTTHSVTFCKRLRLLGAQSLHMDQEDANMDELDGMWARGKTGSSSFILLCSAELNT